MGTLNEDEQRAWVMLLGVLTHLPAALDEELVRTAGISHVEYQVLWWLSVADGERLHMGTLAECAQVSASHLSRIASRLEKRAEIRRGPDPADGRYTQAVLTSAGRERVAECLPRYLSALQRLVFDRLDRPQVGQLERISRNLFAGLHPECTHPVPMASAAIPDAGSTHRDNSKHATERH